MTGPDISKPSGGTGGDAGYGVDAAGGVTTATHSSSFPAATPFSDDSPDSPYGSAAFCAVIVFIKLFFVGH